MCWSGCLRSTIQSDLHACTTLSPIGLHTAAHEAAKPRGNLSSQPMSKHDCGLVVTLQVQDTNKCRSRVKYSIQLFGMLSTSLIYAQCLDGKFQFPDLKAIINKHMVALPRALPFTSLTAVITLPYFTYDCEVISNSAIPLLNPK